VIVVNIQEVMKKGLTKIRLNKWANPDAHIELNKTEDGKYTPWTLLHDDWGKIALGEDEFKKIQYMPLWELDGEEEWVEY